MRKLQKKDYINLTILTLFVLSFVLYLRLNGYIFGSNTDWISQHVILPDYFRNLFYETGTLIPSFNLHLGLGQNIFYFAYYGLLSPWLLISYLLPFIKMIDYIQIISILNTLISIYLIYRWIYDKYDRRTAMLSTILFTLSGPFIYHAHRHIMFVNYMPFLISSLISVDLYFKKKKRVPLIISAFLMIMTSFYFSVPGIIVIGIYSLYLILKNNKKLELRSFIPLSRIIFFIIVAILLAGLLLIPTGYALFSGRSQTEFDINILKLFIPTLDYKLTFYYSYSLGLSFIYIISLIYNFITKKKENIFLSIILALCIMMPIITLVLNNFMYIDGKCYIPFLPIALIVISNFTSNLFKNNVNIRKLFYFLIPVIIIMLYSAIRYDRLELLIFDIIINIVFLIIIYKTKKSCLLFLPIIAVSLTSFIITNNNEQYVKQDIHKYEHEITELTNNIDEFYRTAINNDLLNNVNKVYSLKQLSSTIYSSSSNKNYVKFIRETFQNEIINKDYATITQSSNLLFNIYSGTKYLISDKALLGYKEINSADNFKLYENSDVLPIGYSSSKIMSLREFQTLSYPYSIDALLNYVIVNKNFGNVYNSNVTTIYPETEIISYENLDYEINEQGHHLIKSNSDGKMKLNLNKNINNEILIIKFKMNKVREGKGCSTDITINGINNSLSCSNWKYHNQNYSFEYVISDENSFENLDITFSKGDYDISNIEYYTINYTDISNIKDNISPFIINNKESTNSKISGTINAKEDGYFKLTVPYEKRGFSIFVDGEKVNKIKVDDTFLGFEITKGPHNIEIVYKTPYLKYGLYLSITGVVLLIFTVFYNLIKKPLDIFFKYFKATISYINKQISLFLISNRGYTLLFISMLIPDLALRIFYYPAIKFFGWWKLVPNLFSITWIVFILLITFNLKKKLGKTFYIIVYSYSIILFIVHAIYFSYFNTYFDYSVVSIAGEGATYLDSVILNIKWWVVLTCLTSIYLTIKGFKMIDYTYKIKPIKIIYIFIAFALIHLSIPLLLGNSSKSVEWDDWRNPRSVYKSFNDNNKSMMTSGMYEYNIRNFYTNFIRNNDSLTDSENDLLNENFKEDIKAKETSYSGVFKDKNLIIVQLESIDSFLVTNKIMPTTYKMMKNSINFTDHYSFTSGGGSTFNSEFMVNTGYSSAYQYNQNAYSFSRNSYNHSLPNLLRKEGYKSQVYHMNSKEYYSRGVNYKSFGYDNYYGLKDLPDYKDNTFWLDRELILNNNFNKTLFKNDLFLSYFITYSAHMPFKSSKGTCSLLTEEEGLTEYECLKLQAAETDYFMKLLLEKLEEENLLDNTVIVAFSDHYLYTLEDSSLLDKYKETDNNFINKTPFFIWSNGDYVKTIKKASSQLNILPTILNLFGIEYYENHYIGRDILSPKYDPLVFFPDGSWYDGKTYVENGEYKKGRKISEEKIAEKNTVVRNKMDLNDAVMKSDYFSKNKAS